MVKLYLIGGWSYIEHHQNTSSQYTVTNLILDMCLTEEERPGSQVPKRWCKQEDLDWEVAWKAEMGRRRRRWRRRWKIQGIMGRRESTTTKSEGNSNT